MLLSMSIKFFRWAGCLCVRLVGKKYLASAVSLSFFVVSSGVYVRLCVPAVKRHARSLVHQEIGTYKKKLFFF